MSGREGEVEEHGDVVVVGMFTCPGVYHSRGMSHLD